MRTYKVALAASFLSLSGTANAATIAVFGQNNIGSRYSATGNTVTYVTDAQLASAGFLSGFDLFVYTRSGSSFGTGLSAAAAANVSSYVTSNIVLFNGDFQDDIGAANTNQLFDNALAFVTAGGKGGYIGEYTGSFAAFSSNANGYNPLGLVAGSAGTSGFNQGGADGNVQVGPGGAGSPLLSGVSLPYNPGAVEFSATVTGVNPSGVILSFANGNPALVANSRAQISVGGVPEPSTWAMMLLGFGAIGAGMRRRRRMTAIAQIA